MKLRIKHSLSQPRFLENGKVNEYTIYIAFFGIVSIAYLGVMARFSFHLGTIASRNSISDVMLRRGGAIVEKIRLNQDMQILSNMDSKDNHKDSTDTILELHEKPIVNQVSLR